MRTMLSILLALFSSHLCAEETTELYLHASTCTLTERGVAVKEDPIFVKGIKNEFGCLAFIKDEEFSKRFKFCVYSGFELIHAPNASWYGCAISREMNSFMFSARLDKDEPSSADIQCNFMCFSH